MLPCSSALVTCTSTGAATYITSALFTALYGAQYTLSNPLYTSRKTDTFFNFFPLFLFTLRPYGAYFQLAAGGMQHIQQANVLMRSLQRAVEPGKAQCRQTEFRPKAQELASRSAGWGGRSSFALSELSSEWRTVVTLADPCDAVGRGALAFAKRNDCRAEDRGDGSFWVPMWARWCREGWGVMGMALPEAFDASGNVDGNSATGGYFAMAPTSVNNAQARSSTKQRALTGDALIRAPVVLAGKDNPSPNILAGVSISGTKVRVGPFPNPGLPVSPYKIDTFFYVS